MTVTFLGEEKKAILAHRGVVVLVFPVGGESVQVERDDGRPGGLGVTHTLQ